MTLGDQQESENQAAQDLKMHLRRTGQGGAGGSQLAVSDASDFGLVETGGRLSPFRVVRVRWIRSLSPRRRQVGTIV